jgi:predicted nucleotidyltransferase
MAESEEDMPDETEMSGLLEEITYRIRAITTPERIILFGSHARGEADADSDLDLLVIASGVTHPRQESTRIRRALRGLLVPVDVIVATPEQVMQYRDTIGLIYGTALREGKVLYERSPTA